MNLNELDINFDKMVDDLTEKMASEMLGDPSKSVLTPQGQKERLQEQVREILKGHFSKLPKGITYLLENLHKMTAADEPEVDKALFKIILTKLAEEKTDELTNEELSALFLSAIDLYNTQNYSQAAEAFYVLTEFTPSLPYCWKSLGNSYFHSNQQKEAIEAYATARSLNGEDPEIMVYEARCLYNENRLQEAIDLLNQASEIVDKDSKFQEWKEPIADLLLVFNNK